MCRREFQSNDADDDQTNKKEPGQCSGISKKHDTYEESPYCTNPGPHSIGRSHGDGALGKQQQSATDPLNISTFIRKIAESDDQGKEIESYIFRAR